MTTIILEYNDKTYTIKDDSSEFMWTEGNFSCDCNRSIFIQEQCDKTFERMECGDKIKLIKLEE